VGLLQLTCCITLLAGQHDDMGAGCDMQQLLMCKAKHASRHICICSTRHWGAGLLLAFNQLTPHVHCWQALLGEPMMNP
jgi:hypothetical protein